MAVVSKESVRKGRRIIGHLFALEDGRKVFLSRQRAKDEYRANLSSRVAARQVEKSGWTIDYMLLMELRAQKIDAIGVRVEETGDIYLADIMVWVRKGRMVLNGKRQFLPLGIFRVKRGKVKLR